MYIFIEHFSTLAECTTDHSQVSLYLNSAFYNADCIKAASQ